MAFIGSLGLGLLSGSTYDNSGGRTATKRMVHFSWTRIKTGLEHRVAHAILFKVLPLIILVAGSAGCPHYSSGVPPSLRMPQLRSQIPASGLYHTVVLNETLSGIAKAYQVDLQQLAELNNLKPPYLIRENMKIFVPGASQPKKVEENPPPKVSEERVEDFTGILSWPIEGPVESEFGVRDGSQHNGITISAAEGTPVRSAGAGKVGHVASIAGFGNVILIGHANHLITVYAHLKEMRVESGQPVKRGDVIGTVGTSGRVDAPGLYFEVRSRSKPRNPLFFLPRKAEAAHTNGGNATTAVSR